MTLSRRAFAQLLGAGAAAAALPFPTSNGAPALSNGAPASAGGFPEPAEAGAPLHPAPLPHAPLRPVRLSANENPYGPSSKALQAMRDAMAESRRYPDDAQDALIDAAAKLHNTSAGEVILGDGSSEILKLAAAAFTSPSRKLVIADPTFEAIARYASVAGAAIVKVSLDASYAHDVARMAAVDGAGIIYICNPNNPTGSITPKAAVRKLLESVPPSTIVLVDEAYHHYADSDDYESVMPLVRTRPNLIVARTFSKIFGMAGLRCGYAVAQHDTIAKMQTQQAWDSMNVMALAAALASLGDSAHVADGKKRNTDTRTLVTSELTRLGYTTVPSQTNFVMIDLKRNVKPVIAAMRQHDVHVGRLFPAMPSHLRVTIGRPDEMQRFLAAFRDVMA